MRHGIHIAVTLMAVILVIRPFDCFAARTPSRQAADCCLKGKCVPTANSDECCKNTVPDGGQCVITKATDPVPVPAAWIVTDRTSLIAPMTIQDLVGQVVHLSPRICLTAPSLPLLI